MTLKARGSSIERNRVKRQIREFFRVHGSKFGSFDYNVVIPGTKKMQFPFDKILGRCLKEQCLYALKND